MGLKLEHVSYLYGTDTELLVRALDDVNLELRYDGGGLQHMILNGADVTEEIRTPEMSREASLISAQPAVRAFLLDLQRDMAKRYSVMMDGRDIGTVVLPNATVKIFLTATPEARAERRYKELLMKGEKHDYQKVLADVRARDYQDTHRAAAPLRQAEDAVLVDTSDLNFDQSFEALKKVIQDRAK